MTAAVLLDKMSDSAAISLSLFSLLPQPRDDGREDERDEMHRRWTEAHNLLNRSKTFLVD